MERQLQLAKIIRDLRSRHSMSQDELAKKLGFSSRQIVSQMENGERQVSAVELNALAQLFGVSMTHFFPTENDSLSGVPEQGSVDSVGVKGSDGRVLWRARPTSDATLLGAQFLRAAADFALFERLHDGDRPVLRRKKLPNYEVDLRSFTRSHAEDLARRVRDEIGLDVRCPATSLVRTLDEDYGVRFFTDEQIPLMAEKKRESKNQSGDSSFGSAACALAEDSVPCILVNSSEPRWRQNFSVAHELFHLVTWSNQTLDAIEADAEHASRVEKLAEAFAAALLMPPDSVQKEVHAAVTDGKIALSSLVAIARSFDVSLHACLIRLGNLKHLKQETVTELLENKELKRIDRVSREAVGSDGYRYSSRLLRLGYVLMERGDVSRAKVARALGISLVDLDDLLESEGLVETEDSVVEASYT